MVLWNCPGCYKKFKTFREYEKHAAGCENVRIGHPIHVCKGCGAAFRKESARIRHENMCMVKIVKEVKYI